jgi:DNA-binding MarR family transcriptional regulator
MLTSQQREEVLPAQAVAKRSAAPAQAWLDLAEDGSNLDLTEFPSFRLVEAHALIHRNVTRVYLSGFGLGVPEWRLLALLARRSPLSLREVNARSWMDKGQISRAATLLAERKLLDRQADPQHGKRQVLRITAAGMRLFKKIWPEAQRSQAMLLASLSPAERSALFSGLDKLLAAADAYAKQFNGGTSC